MRMPVPRREPRRERHQVTDNMNRYQVTCTNTYRVWARTEEDAILIAESINDGTYYPDHLGYGKCVETGTEAEPVSNE